MSIARPCIKTTLPLLTASAFLCCATLCGCGSSAADTALKTDVVTFDQASQTYSYVTSSGQKATGAYLAASGLVYLASDQGVLSDTGWFTSDAYGQGEQLYYVDQQTHACIPGFSQQDSYHYTSMSGAVARGGFTVNGRRYFADQQGVILTSQWVTTGDFTQGEEQTYWASEDGSLAMTPGFKEIGGKQCYVTDEGYLLKGKLSTDKGIILALEDGTLLENSLEEGWVTTDALDGAKHTYYLREIDGHLYAQAGFFSVEEDGQETRYYADPQQGYLKAGKIATDDGIVLANGQGMLAESYLEEGWYLGDDFDTLEQRYYLEERDGHLYAKTGWFTVDGYSYFGLEDQGFLSRNGMVLSEGTYYASDSLGRLSATSSYIGGTDDYLDTVTWLNNPYYFEWLAEQLQSLGSDTDYAIVGDYSRCRLVVFQRASAWKEAQEHPSDTDAQAQDDEDDLVTDPSATAYGNISVTNSDTETGWIAIKAYNGNFGVNSWQGVYDVCHKMPANIYENSVYLSDGSENPSAYSTCFLEAWADSQPSNDWQDPDTGLWHDCASIHSTETPTTGYDQRGCLALLRANAKWIYDNVPLGSRVYVFE